MCVGVASTQIQPQILMVPCLSERDRLRNRVKSLLDVWDLLGGGVLTSVLMGRWIINFRKWPPLQFTKNLICWGAFACLWCGQGLFSERESLADLRVKGTIAVEGRKPTRLWRGLSLLYLNWSRLVKTPISMSTNFETPL